MGYIDGIVDPQFQHIEGKRVWFPWGTFIKGFVVSEEQESKARQFVTSYYIISFVILFPLVIFRKAYLLALSLFLISLVYYWYKVRAIAKNAQRVRNKSTLLQIYQRQAKSMGRKTIIVQFISMFAISSFFGFGVIFLGLREWWMIATFLMTVLFVIYSWYLLKHSK